MPRARPPFAVPDKATVQAEGERKVWQSAPYLPDLQQVWPPYLAAHHIVCSVRWMHSYLHERPLISHTAWSKISM